jgi:hypothetical protein
MPLGGRVRTAGTDPASTPHPFNAPLTHQSSGLIPSRCRGPHGVLRGGLSAPPLGAKLGAILCGQRWTAVDADGTRSLSFRAVVDGCGRLWTRLGDLRITRLGIRVLPGVLRKLVSCKSFQRGYPTDASDVWAPFGIPLAVVKGGWRGNAGWPSADL